MDNAESHPATDLAARCPNCGHRLSMFIEAPQDANELKASWVIGRIASLQFPAALLALIVTWMAVNIAFRPFEPYPMVMLAACAAALATIAAIQAPLILLTQRRSAIRDRERDRATYLVAANTERDMHALRDEVRGLVEEVSILTRRLAASSGPSKDSREPSGPSD